MRIGIDIDNTICSTDEKLCYYENIFINDENISRDNIWNDSIYKNKFLNLYLEKIYKESDLKKDALEVIKKILLNNEVYIITARSNNYVNNMISLINKYFSSFDLKIDKIIINAKDKVDACLNNDIDIMIDDNLYNYNKLLDNGINSILFDDKGRNIFVKNRVTCWKDIEKIIANLEE